MSYNSPQCPSMADSMYGFQMCDPFEDSMGMISVAVEKCQLCGGTKRKFFCAKCINDGEIVQSFRLDSTKASSETLSVKLEKWKHAKKTRLKVLTKFEEKVKERSHLDEKKLEVEKMRRKIDLLKKALDDAKEERDKEIKTLEECKVDINQWNLITALHVEKMTRLLKKMNKHQVNTNFKLEKYFRIIKNLKMARIQLTEKLFRQIFPIEEVQLEKKGSAMEMSMVTALADARHTHYLHGGWISTHNGAPKYRIVAPTLPRDGNYSQYTTICQENKNLLNSPDDTGSDIGIDPSKNPMWCISAALCHTTQLVSILAHLLGINLPKKLCYSEFCMQELNEADFEKAVYKLNQNVRHLCIKQGVPPENMDFRRTLHNMLMLQKSPHLGNHWSETAVNPDDMLKFEEMDKQVRRDLGIESSGDEDELLDWYQIHEAPEIPEWNSPPSYSSYNSSQMDSTIQSSGVMATGVERIKSIFGYRSATVDNQLSESQSK